MASQQEIYDEMMLDFYGEQHTFPPYTSFDHEREITSNLIPNKLLIDLLEEGRHLLKDVLVQGGYSLDDSSLRDKLIQKGYSLDDPKVKKMLDEGGYNLDDPADKTMGKILHETELDPYWSLDPKYGYSAGDLTPDQAASWGIDQLIKDLSNNKILTYFLHEEREGEGRLAGTGPYGLYETTSEWDAPNLARVWNRSLLPHHQNKEDSWLTEGYYVNPDDPDGMRDYMDAIMHEVFLHGVGGTHSGYGNFQEGEGTFHGNQWEYDDMMDIMIDELSSTESYGILSDYLYDLIEDDNMRRQRLRLIQSNEPDKMYSNWYYPIDDFIESMK